MQAYDWQGVRVFTVGHSTRSLDELVDLLRAFEVKVVADIRTIPRSRHNPQFNAEALGPSLRARKLRYVHIPELGGLRHARKDSPNAAWRNASFRGYADYMQTEAFEAGLAKLRELAAVGCVALMCAEAVPFRCHRSLVADVLTARGADVEHITSATHASHHRMTPFAHVEGLHVTYPAELSGRLTTRAPFHLEATVRVLQRRPNHLVDVWEHESYRRALTTASGDVLVEVTNHGSIDAPDVHYRVLHGELAASELEARLRRILGLDVDPEPLLRMAATDPKLRRVARSLRGLRPPRFPDLFETVANVVPFQQVSLDAGVAATRRLVEQFGASFEHEGHRWHTFPRASTIAGADLALIKGTGLSLKKAETLQYIARQIEEGVLREREFDALSSAQASERLQVLPGIGPWSAGLILLRGFGRLDVFPPGDAGAARGLGQLMNASPGKALERILARYGEQRGYLYFFVLGSSLLGKHLIADAA